MAGWPTGTVLDPREMGPSAPAWASRLTVTPGWPVAVLVGPAAGTGTVSGFLQAGQDAARPANSSWTVNIWLQCGQAKAIMATSKEEQVLAHDCTADVRAKQCAGSRTREFNAEQGLTVFSPLRATSAPAPAAPGPRRRR